MNPVDSWIALAQNNKYQYYWYDEIKGFIKSNYRTNQTTYGGIMSTVNQLYSEQLDLNNVAYALYNDDPPPPLDVASSTYAHSKGMILTNDNTGFWLIHSKPNWPNQRADGPIPFPDSTYSQSLMCITFNTTTFDTIASGALINYPYLYDSYISSNLISIIPNFNTWINKGKSSTLNMTYVLKSKGGKSFLQFAKSKAWGRDLYDDFVAPVLEKSIHVETWRSGSGGRMGSVCSNTDDDTWLVHPNTYDIIEVSVVTMPDGATWKGTEDHSKWVSTIDYGSICIGDINRMCSQEGRGGGTVCVMNIDVNLWNSFNNAITSVEDCWAYNPCAGSSTQCYWCPSKSPTLKPTFTPTIASIPTISSAPSVYVDVVVGDVAILLIDSDNPDTFAVVALSTIPIGYIIKFTDNAWTGSTLQTNEGTIQFTVSTLISPGIIWYYDGTTMTNTYGTWSKVQGTFSLATAGDQILVYSGLSTNPYFLFGLSTIPWVQVGTTIDTSNSVLPTSLSLSNVNASIYFNDIDNAIYNGTTTGTIKQLQNSICNSLLWVTSDTILYSPSQLHNFNVITLTNKPTSLPTLVPTPFPTNIYDTLTVSQRTIECYSDCSYNGMISSPSDWDIEDYCQFYSESTSCSILSVSDCSCIPNCLLDCPDVFCDSMSTLVYACNNNIMYPTFKNKTNVESSCLSSYASQSPTKTQMTFIAEFIFNNVDPIEMKQTTSINVAITTLSVSISGIPANQIKIIEKNDITSNQVNDISLSVNSIINYEITVILESLGYNADSASTAYDHLITEITESVVSGSFQQNLRALGYTTDITTFQNAIISTIPTYSSPIIINIETYLPTILPTISSNNNEKSNSNNNNKQNKEISSIIGGIIGGFIGLIIVILIIKYTWNNNKKNKNNIEIETRNTFDENIIKINNNPLLNNNQK